MSTNSHGYFHIKIILLEYLVENKEFLQVRKKLNKTQKQMAQLLGTSIKAIHSYEQGWRSVPVHIERQIYFLLSRLRGNSKKINACWTIKRCHPQRKKNCPAWEFQSGELCWFINGTICEGTVQKNWREKMKICRSCEVLTSIMETLTLQELQQQYMKKDDRRH